MDLILHEIEHLATLAIQDESAAAADEEEAQD
jgi:hypothetical protein